MAFIFVFNFTVAEGTFNGLTLYANILILLQIVPFSFHVFFPRDETKILTVFIAWLNLDFGFETCFYDGMDGYVKTWLQFAFSLCVISLVVAIIIISDYSNGFAELFTGKNPIKHWLLLSYSPIQSSFVQSLLHCHLLHCITLMVHVNWYGWLMLTYHTSVENISLFRHSPYCCHTWPYFHSLAVWLAVACILSKQRALKVDFWKHKSHCFHRRLSQSVQQRPSLLDWTAIASTCCLVSCVYFKYSWRSSYQPS